MPVTLPIDIYEVFEDTFGKEGAHKVVKSFEATISDAIDYKWKVTKDELLDAIRKEFVTRELFEENINTLRAEMQGMRAELLGEMKKDKAELLGIIEKNKIEIEGKIEKISQTLWFMIILMIIALTLMNPVAAEIIKGLLKI